MRATRRSRSVAWLWALGLWAWPLAAHAQSDAQTEERFEQGLALFDRGAHDEAAAVWEALLSDLGPDRGWKLSYNLGLAYDAAGKPTEAVERFQAFINRVAASVEALPPEIEQRREDAAARVRAIKSAHGELHFPASAPGVVVSVDGGPARPSGFTAYLPPGHHRIVVTGPRGHTRQSALEVVAGAHHPIDTRDPTPPPPKPAPLPPAAPPPVVFQGEPPSFPTWWVVGGAVATGASFALVGALYGEASTRRDEAAALGEGHTDYAAANEAYEDARTSYHLSYLLPAGLAAVTLGIATVGIIRIATHEPAQTGVSWDARGLRVRF